MLTLLVAMAGLGLAAIDPIGIAAMPILLAQNRPYRRAGLFLLGSLTSLVVFGMLFASGLGLPALHFQQRHDWVVPVVEAFAAVILLGIAVGLIWRIRQGISSGRSSPQIQRLLKLGELQLFGAGALLVAIQSVVDVVFAVAMIRVGELALSTTAMLAAVVAYAVAAVAIQLAVVVGFRLTPVAKQVRLQQTIQIVVGRYGDKVVASLSSLIGLGLLCAALFHVS